MTTTDEDGPTATGPAPDDQATVSDGGGTDTDDPDDSDDAGTGSDDPDDAGPLRIAAVTVGRVMTDLLVVGLWVAFLSLLFLSTGWPRWGFYALVVLGAVGYVQFTAPWSRAANRG